MSNCIVITSKVIYNDIGIKLIKLELSSLNFYIYLTVNNF